VAVLNATDAKAVNSVRVRGCRLIYRNMQPACRCILLIALVSNGCGGAGGDAPAAGATPLIEALRGALARDGLAAALDSLEAAAARDSAVLRDAHQLAHDLGRTALQSAGSPSVIAQCGPMFSSGCYHGVVESYVQRRGAVDMAELERMCAGAGGPDTPGPVSECVHGLGHGVLGALSLDLDRTLRYCDALSSPDHRGGCHSGAFMEAVMTALRERTPDPAGAAHKHAAHEHGSGEAGRLTIDASDPFSPCARFDDPYAKACWVYQGFLVLRQAGFNARAALERCRQAPEGRVAQCAQSVGFQITGLFQRGDGWIIEQCGRGAGLANECGAGAAAALTSMDWSGNRATRFCEAASAAWQAACLASAGRVLRTLATPADLQRFSQRTAKISADACGPLGDRGLDGTGSVAD
jgi:hypothetical protein